MKDIKTEAITIEHSLLSASGAYKWVKSPAEAIMSYEMINSTNKHAERGTQLHDLLAKILIGYEEGYEILADKVIIGENTYPIKNYGEDFNKVTKNEPEALKEIVNKFFKYFNSLGKNTKIKIETRVFYNEFLGVTKPELAFGTADICVIESKGNKTVDLHILDAKFGYNEQKARNNSQLALYALGFVDYIQKANSAWKINNIYMNILQPGYDSEPWAVCLDALIEFIEPYKKPAQRAQAIHDGDAILNINDYTKPIGLFWASLGVYNYAQCAKAKRVHSEFKKISLLEYLPTSDLSECLKIAEDLEGWINEVKKYAIEQAKSGVEIKDYKLVESKAKPVKWKEDLNNLAEELSVLLNEPEETFIKSEVISPAKLKLYLIREKNAYAEKEEVLDFIVERTIRDEPNKILRRVK